MALIAIYCPSCQTMVGTVNTLKRTDGRQTNINAELLLMPVADIQWKTQATRIKKMLQAENITTVGELVTKSTAELRRVPNFGETSLSEIRIRLHDLGLDLGMET